MFVARAARRPMLSYGARTFFSAGARIAPLTTPATAKKRKQQRVFDPSYSHAFELESTSEGRCLVKCDSRKYDWLATAQAFVAAPVMASDGDRVLRQWELVLQKDEFMLVRERLSTAEAFLFPYGVTVLWSKSEHEEQVLAKDVQQLLKRVGGHDVEQEDWEFVSAPEDSSVMVDTLTLDSRISRLAAKLAASTALAQEQKLSVFEEQVDRAIDLIETIPESMALHGQLRFSRKEINRKYGEMMMVRTSINLHSDVLDLPEFFFELSEGKETYLATNDYLQTTRRARVLNERLELLTHLYTMLADDHSKNVSHRLEWLIILLISTEIGIALFKW